MSGKKCVHSPPPPPLTIIVIIIIIRSLMSLGEGGWSQEQEMDTTMYEIVGSRSKEVLKKMQKAALSGTLNIARTLKL